MARTKTRTKIDFSDPRDLTVLVLGAMGLATTFIEEKTGRSPGQIGYRLKIVAIKRSDYRNGTGPVVQTILRSMRATVTARMEAAINSPMVKGRKYK